MQVRGYVKFLIVYDLGDKAQKISLRLFFLHLYFVNNYDMRIFIYILYVIYKKKTVPFGLDQCTGLLVCHIVVKVVH